MPRFNKESIIKLETCHFLLRKIFNKVIKDYDCKVIEGYRSSEEQKKLYNLGLTKVKKGKHNKNPSLAIDVAPYPVIFPNKFKEPYTYCKDLARFYHFAGFVEAISKELKIPIIWGGDWNCNHDFHDQTFDDLIHFELKYSPNILLDDN